MSTNLWPTQQTSDSLCLFQPSMRLNEPTSEGVNTLLPVFERMGNDLGEEVNDHHTNEKEHGEPNEEQEPKGELIAERVAAHWSR